MYAQSLSEAQANGDAHYFTNKPCKHGHRSLRRTSNGRCVACDQKYYKDNQSELKQRSSARHEANRDEILAKRRADRRANPERYKRQQRQYYAENKERVLASNKRYVERNKETVYAKRKEWALENATYIKVNHRNYMRERLKTDPLFNLRHRLRTRIQKAFRCDRNTRKPTDTESIVGCSIDDLKRHIENQFSDGMCWENRDQWHIDHIVPLASAETEEDMISLCHYTNLQPLWAEDNMRKGDSLQCK